MVEVGFTLPNGRLIAIAMDATVRETHTSTAIATEHPVEAGANVTDHVRADLPRLSVEAFVTNAPIRVPRVLSISSALNPGSDQLDGITGNAENVELDVPDPPINRNVAGLVGAAFGALFPSPHSARVLRFSGEFDRVGKVYALMSAIVELGTPCIIGTSLRKYENMVIENLSTPVESADAIQFTFDAKEIRTVESEIVEAPEPVEDRARQRRRRGAQQTTPAKVVTEGRVSWLQAGSAATGFGSAVGL